jgi:hypothetical protein
MGWWGGMDNRRVLLRSSTIAIQLNRHPAQMLFIDRVWK